MQRCSKLIRRFLTLMVFSVLMIIISCTSLLFAQETINNEKAEVMILDWDQAWKLALEKNESHKIAKNEVNRANFQVKQAYSSAMPTVNMNGTYNHYFEVPSVIFNMPSMGGAPAMRMKMKMAQENNIAANIQLTQPVWLAGKVGLALKIAKEYAKISQMGVQVSREDLRVALLQTFYGAIITDKYLEVSREALEQAERYRDQVQDMYDQGIVSEYDLIRSKVSVSNFKPMVSEAEASRDLAEKGLKNLIGVDVDMPVRIEGDLDMMLASPELDYNNASSFALTNRLELKQLQLQKKLYGYQYKIEKRNWLWPNFLVGLRWETTAQSEDINVPKYEFLNGVGGQVIMQIPLFDGFSSKNAAQIVKVNMRNVDLQSNQLERGIKMQVFSALRTYRKSSEELQAAIENLEQSEKGYSIAETRYKGGVGTQLEVLDAQIQLNTSKVNLLQAKYNQLIAVAQYDRAIGKGFSTDEGK